MKAIRIHQFGGPEVLQLEELPTPEPGPGQVLARVEAAGVNFLDVYQRTGLYQISLPRPMGMEGAGTVEAVGPDVAKVSVGDRIAWANLPGGYATHAVLPADRLVVLPREIDTQQAAAAMLQGLTAHYLAYSTHPISPWDTCLVHAAAGGVGQLLCQVLKLRGVRVIGTAGSEAKAQVAREAGADEVILYTQQNFEAEVKRLTGGEGAGVVFDSVGRDTYEKSLSCLRRRGGLVLFGQSSGAVPPIDPLVLMSKGSLWLTRPTLGDFIATTDELRWRAGDLLGWITSGKVRLRIDRTHPLAEAAAAHQALTGRETMGKVLLIP